MGSALRRFPLPVPEWCRTEWVSEKARALWEPRLTAISQAWQATERASVGSVRRAARQSVPAEQYAEYSRKAAAQGLTLIALSQEPTGASYQARPALLSPGAPWAFQVALCETPAAGADFLAAWQCSDDAAIGRLLGFPPCCVAFFERIWKAEAWLDTTWPMALETPLAPGDRLECSTAGCHERRTLAGKPVEANILLRWLGLRWVPHLPCSFECPGTVALGRRMRDVMAAGHPDEALWLDELLDSPIEWSGFRGIAEIQHPLFRVSAKTDATAERVVVRRHGPRYPEHGATGNYFPFREACAAPAPTAVPIAVPISLIRSERDPRLWQDNGFASLTAMRAAHDVIERFYRNACAADPVDRVLDLGCGNGELAGRLSRSAQGVEADAGRAQRAPSRSVIVHHTTIEAFVHAPATAVTEGPFDCVLLMPGRLIEMSSEDAAQVRAWLRSNAKVVLVYAYGDWRTRSGTGLSGLCRKAGLELGSAVVDDAADVEVGLVRVER